MSQNNQKKEPHERDEKGRILTLYRPEYDELLIQHLNEGLSFESFAAVVDVCKQTIYSWSENFPSFKAAKERGLAKSLLFWEKIGKYGAQGLVPNFNCGSWAFNMKNRFGWRDRQEIKTLQEGVEFSEVVTHDKIMSYIEGKEF